MLAQAIADLQLLCPLTRPRAYFTARGVIPQFSMQVMCGRVLVLHCTVLTYVGGGQLRAFVPFDGLCFAEASVMLLLARTVMCDF